MNKEEINDANSGNNLVNKNNQIAKNSHNKDKLGNFDNYSEKNIYKYSGKNSINYNEKDWLIDKINLKETLMSICCSFKRKRRNVYKLLLNETMNIITEKLDIFNLFRDLCTMENSKDDYNSRIIKMSKECSNRLQDI